MEKFRDLLHTLEVKMADERKKMLEELEAKRKAEEAAKEARLRAELQKKALRDQRFNDQVSHANIVLEFLRDKCRMITNKVNILVTVVEYSIFVQMIQLITEMIEGVFQEAMGKANDMKQALTQVISEMPSDIIGDRARYVRLLEYVSGEITKTEETLAHNQTRMEDMIKAAISGGKEYFEAKKKEMETSPKNEADKQRDAEWVKFVLEIAETTEEKKRLNAEEAERTNLAKMNAPDYISKTKLREMNKKPRTTTKNEANKKSGKTKKQGGAKKGSGTKKGK